MSVCLSLSLYVYCFASLNICPRKSHPPFGLVVELVAGSEAGVSGHITLTAITFPVAGVRIQVGTRIEPDIRHFLYILLPVRYHGQVVERDEPAIQPYL